ncbi:hypothetical protein C0J52_18080 [Blattella germanica]|nr:hypothetical protein C0J52_18080 [Blattella germanica]
MLDQDRVEMKQFLAVKQIVIGEEAKDGELQIIEVEVNEEAKMPIARLKKGGAEMCPLDIKFTNCPVKFSLINGSGPVHILGNHIMDLERVPLAVETDSEGMGELEMEGEEEEVAEEEEDEEEVEKPKNDGGKPEKKKKTSADSGGKGKKGNSTAKSPPAKRKK